MTRLVVTPDDLRVTSGVLRNLAAEFDEQPTTRYRADPAQVGDTVLASALAEFQERSSTAIRVVSEDAQALHERLKEAAAAYEDCDAATRDRLHALVEGA